MEVDAPPTSVEPRRDKRTTAKLVVLAVTLVALMGSCFLPAPGWKKGLTRNGLVTYLDRFQLPPGSIVTQERYHGSDECRVYQWLQFRCEDSNYLQRTILFTEAASVICEQILRGELGLGRAPDWQSPAAVGSDIRCYFRYDISPGVSVGGSVIPRGPAQSRLDLNANSSREP